MKEPEDKCIHKRLFLDYIQGLGKIYSKEEVAKAKHHLRLKGNMTSNT